jgi:hypothetical protein
MIRNLINLVENGFTHTHVMHLATRESAKKMIADSVVSLEPGDFGYGFYTVMHITLPLDDPEKVVLEYRVEEGARILDLHDDSDMLLWHTAGAIDHMDNENMWKLMMRRGIDGVKSREQICFYNPYAAKFFRVYSGVVNDPLEETDTNQLDEFALGGLQRCTAVTCNALLKDFHLRPILLNDVPVDHPGVLRILTERGLAYRPEQTNSRTVQQFVNIHKLYDWYLLSPGHAMALIRGELFDAENRGPDARPLEAAFQITRR